MIAKNINTVYSSSVGRLFDKVVANLEIMKIIVAKTIPAIPNWLISKNDKTIFKTASTIELMLVSLYNPVASRKSPKTRLVVVIKNRAQNNTKVAVVVRYF